MASLFNLQIVTPDGLILDEQVENIILRTTEGDTGILKGHAGYVSAIKAGKVKVKTENGPKIGVASEGFIRVGKEKTTLVATTFEWADKIDVDRAKRSLELAREIISANENTDNVLIAKNRLKRAKARLAVAEEKRDI